MMAGSCLRKGDGGGVPSSTGEMTSKSRGLQSEQKDDQHIDWCRLRLKVHKWEKLVINR